MPSYVLVLASLFALSNARRVQSYAKRSDSDLSSESPKILKRAAHPLELGLIEGAHNPLVKLMMLFATFNPAAAFKFSHRGARHGIDQTVLGHQRCLSHIRALQIPQRTVRGHFRMGSEDDESDTATRDDALRMPKSTASASDDIYDGWEEDDIVRQDEPDLVIIGLVGASFLAFFGIIAAEYYTRGFCPPFLDYCLFGPTY